MTDTDIDTTTLATDRQLLEIETKARTRKVMHWPELIYTINRIRKSEAELAEARAQIAAYERAAKEGDTDPTTGRYTAEDIAHMKSMQFEALPKWAQNELIGLRAQIAAKDAALQSAYTNLGDFFEDRDMGVVLAVRDDLEAAGVRRETE